MKKTIVRLSLLSIAMAGSAFAAGNMSLNAQVQDLQQQVANLQTQVNQMGTAQSSSMGAGQYVQLNSAVTSQMMGNFGGVNREMVLLNSKKDLQNETLYLGGYAEAGATWQKSNNNGDSYTTSGGHLVAAKSSSNVSLDHVAFDMIGNLNQYATAYIQAGANNITSNGSSESDQVSFQQAYLLLGNAGMPVYGFVGKKDIDFGNFSTVNMFAQPLTRELFMATANTAGIGYQAYGFNVTASLMNGGPNGTLNQYGAGFWNLSTAGLPTTGLYTQNQNQANNFALNGSYGMDTNGINWAVGGGYLNGSAFPGTSVDAAGHKSRVAAWDLNGQVGFQSLNFVAEYVSTAQKAEAITGTVGRVNAWDMGANYSFNAGFVPNMSVVSFDYSGAHFAGNDGVRVNQYVLGARNEIFPKANMWAGIEYAYDRFSGGGSDAKAFNNNNVRLDLTTNF